MSVDRSDPHGSAPVLQAGRPLEDAELALLLVHGRGATAESMLDFARELPVDDAALLAPQAVGHQWYPHPFLAELEDNEPWLSSGLQLLDRIVGHIVASGPGRGCTVVLGFSQGACLALEFVARRPARYGGVAGLSGGLIGPPGMPRSYEGSLDGTPVFLGCGDRDPHIPIERVEETTGVLRGMGADVSMRIYRGMGHTVSQDEIAEVSRMIERIRASTTGPDS